MSEIINSIIQKPLWQTKIKDATIVSKWKEELQAQGISATVLDKTIELLKKSQVEKNEDYYDATYEWHIEIGADPRIWRGCQSCECLICSEQEYLLRGVQDYDEGDEEYRDELGYLICKVNSID
eukprot:gene5933-6378_t